MSGEESAIAALRTMTAAPATNSGKCPMETGIPLRRSIATVSESLRSLPVTCAPRRLSSSASDDIITPPIPIK